MPSSSLRWVGKNLSGVQKLRNAVRSPNHAKGVWNQLGTGVGWLVNEAGDTMAYFGELVVKGITLFATCVFNQALTLAGISPDQFWEKVKKLVGRFPIYQGE